MARTAPIKNQRFITTEELLEGTYLRLFIIRSTSSCFIELCFAIEALIVTASSSSSVVMNL